MNKIQLAINVILVVAVATLFGLYITGNKSTNEEVAPTVEKMPLAYLNTDSLLANYTFAQEANEKLMKKQEKHVYPKVKNILMKDMDILVLV